MITKPTILAVAALLALLAVPSAPVPAQDAPSVEQLVPDLRPSAELSDAEIRARIDAAQAAMAEPSLAADAKKSLRRLLKADKSELDNRAAAAATPEPVLEAPAASAPEATTSVDPPAAEAVQEAPAETAPADPPTAEVVQEAPAETLSEPPPADIVQEAPVEPALDDPAMAEAVALLQDGRGMADLTGNELKQRLRTARALSKNDKLPAEVREQLTDVATAARKALLALEAQGKETPAAEATQEPATSTPATAEPSTETPAAEVAVEVPGAAVASETVTPGAASTADVTAEPVVSKEAELKADELLAEAAPSGQADKDSRRERLEAYRALLDDGKLSRPKQRALRQRLKAERDALRARVAEEETVDAAKEAKAAETAGGDAAAFIADAPIAAPTEAEIPRIIADERDSRVLAERDLNRRIRAYRASVRDKRIAETERAAYVADLETDRAELKRRLVADKRKRQVRLRKVRDRPRITVDIDLSRGRDEAPSASIFAAEADDEDIEAHLVARPIRRLPRQYRATRREIIARPDVYVSRREVREALPSIEVDTITFGFNEAFVREEEIVNLDRLALAMERILAAHPDEVFLIEGHTDAVGSDVYNLKLSRERAQAVKRALVEYYVIPPEALTTAGLGEQFLKIWTPEPEQENRRVTLRRLTALLSDYDGGDEEDLE